MHTDQLTPTVADVERLVRGQHRRLLGAVRSVSSTGTECALFRVGEDLVARLPLQPQPLDDAREARDREVDAATRLLTSTTIATPEPVAVGEPDHGYPMPWALYRWLPGEPARPERHGESSELAVALATFVGQVRAMPTQGRSFEGTGRGGDLTRHDEGVLRGIERSAHLIDAASLGRSWQTLRELPRHEPDRWAHNDLMPGNVLVAGDRLCAVIDVGTLQVADPAVDLQPAWNLFGRAARAAYRDAVGDDELSWQRGRAWALVQAIGCLWYYERTNPAMSRTAHRTLTAVLEG